jgi:hypothetical protein
VKRNGDKGGEEEMREEKEWKRKGKEGGKSRERSLGRKERTISPFEQKFCVRACGSPHSFYRTGPPILGNPAQFRFRPLKGQQTETDVINRVLDFGILH